MTPGFLLRQRTADLLNVFFLLLLTTLTAVFRQRVGNPSLLILLYSCLILIQVLLLLVKERGKFLRLFHAIIFPTLSILLIFDSLEWLVHDINPRDIDPLLIRLDYMLFGGYPTVMLEGIMSPLLTDLLQVAYSSYYFMPVSLGVILYRKGRTEELDRSLFFIMLCFYLSYAGYLLFPALGPRYTIAHLQTGELEGLILTGPLQNLLNSLEGVKRDAFPSGHTGVALTVLWLAWKYERKLGYVLAPASAALIFSTVYCRYHYVIDVIGGIALAVITLLTGEIFYGYRSQRINSGR
ncbi:MAG: phosphatase PAP2 family protein [Thermodesulfovibrionales bacterium]